MRWIFILMLVLAGCRQKPATPVPGPASPEPSASLATEVVPRSPANPPPAPSPPRSRLSRAGHPGEPANPEALRGLPEKYFNQVGSFPNSWQQMIERKYLTAVPLGKNGKPLDFRQYSEWTTLPP